MSHQQLVFLDTEFTTLAVNSELISMALVDAAGERELYLESTSFDPKACSYFVLDAVLPLLGPISNSPNTAYAALPLSGFARVITDWASVYPVNTAVACDHGFDWMWLDEVMGGDFPPSLAPRPLMLDAWAADPQFEISRQAFFEREGLQQHHALHDARALRHAFLMAQARVRAGGADD